MGFHKSTLCDLALRAVCVRAVCKRSMPCDLFPRVLGLSSVMADLDEQNWNHPYKNAQLNKGT
eukprot:1118775-Amphidinium_carterae.2